MSLARLSSALLVATGIGFVAGLGASCASTEPNPDHCANNGGDAHCLHVFSDGSKPHCTSGKDGCATGDRYGCVSADDLVPSCHLPCGSDPDMACDEGVLDESGTGTADTGTSLTAGGTTEEDMSCLGNSDCTDADAPFCSPAGVCVPCDALDDPDGACAEFSPDTPACSATGCVQCTSVNTVACSGKSPVCGDDFSCRGCEEHAECPNSACHLDGSDRGACFHPRGVQMISTTAELHDALAGLSGNEPIVLVLTASNYSGVQAEVLGGNEVAIIATGMAALSGDTAGALVSAASSARLYLSRVTVLSNGSGLGIDCSGSSVWVDDSTVRNNHQAGLRVSSGCKAHVRRTEISNNHGGGLSASGNSSALHLLNTAIAGHSSASGDPAINLSLGASLEMVYSSVVANFAASNPDSIVCGNATGSVRNSIVLGIEANSIFNCTQIAFEHNALDTADLGATNEIFAYDIQWFQTPSSGNARLTSPGAVVFDAIAQWQPGDPLTDIENQPIPVDAPSHPGYHQP